MPAVPPATDPGSAARDEDPLAAGLTGREATIGTAALPDWLSGREATLGAGGGADPLSGREATLETTAAPLVSGREMTLEGVGLSGRESTLAAGVPPLLTGREATLGLPAGAGTEETSATIAGMLLDPRRPAPGDPPTSPTLAGPVAGTPAPGTPSPGTHSSGSRTRVGTSVQFDEGWHLQGRKGPFTGQVWGDFDIGGILGEGGMGAVYRAVQRSLKRRVAIKVLPPNLAADMRLRQRFQLEARTSSMLSSPHVVAVYAVGEHDGNHFYAMEYVQGTDLYEVLKARREEGKGFGNDECVSYILQAAKGLAEAARHGVVHRDIKPPNLMVNQDGLLKITDFGIAKLIGEHHLTMTGQAVGTPAYVSPEQGRGEGGIDARSDIYSLGVVFYELATMRKPFVGTTPNALIYQHCYEEPDLPRKLNPDISEEVQAVILRCLQKKPENRYQAADDLARDLDAIRTGSLLKSAIASYRLGTGAEEAKREQMNWFQRNLLPLAVAAALVVAGGGGLGWWLLERQSSQRFQQQRLASELLPRLGQLNGQQPLYDGVDDDLRRYAEIKGQDASWQQWNRKVEEVRALESRLAVLDAAGTPAQAVRVQARADLTAYQQMVGTTDARGVRWSEAQTRIDADERQMRDQLAEQFDRNRIDLSTRDDTAVRLARLATMVAADDGQVAAWQKALAAFDAQVAGWIRTLDPLSDTARAVQDRQRAAYTAAIDRLAELRWGDARLAQWRDRLSKAGKLIDTLRSEVDRLLARDLAPEGDLKAAELKLAQYRPLVDEADDADLKRWLGLIAGSRQVIAARRAEIAEAIDPLGKDGRDEALPVPQVGPMRQRLSALRDLVPTGDVQLIRWDTVVAASAAAHAALAGELAALDPSRPDPVTLAAQASLAKSLVRYQALGGLAFDQVQVYQARLEAERRRVDALRERLAAFDRASSITADLRSGLDRLSLDAGQDDADVKRWRAKLDRVDVLRATLIKLDQRQGFPERADDLAGALEREVGKDDADLTRWRGVIARLTRLEQALRPIDRPGMPLPADADAALREYESLAGGGEKAYVDRRRKVDQCQALRSELGRLHAQRVLGDAALVEAEDRQAALIALVGNGEDDVRAIALRIAELAGPRPAWAARTGRDAFGPWAELDAAGRTCRFRWIAPGSVQVGSPAGEPGHEADEVQVPLRVTRGLWLADSETTQALWLAVAGANPSLFPGETRPVERVSWLEVTAWIERLRALVAGQALRLPSEAEWELACRAGELGPWPAADQDPAATRIAWTRRNAAGTSHEVRQRYPNPHGLFDMQGNVWEWCADGYVPYPTSETADRLGVGGDARVARGGSWGDPPQAVRAANRLRAAADLRSAYLGFRLAAEAEWDGGPDPRPWLVDRLVRTRAIEIPLGGSALVRVELQSRRQEEAKPQPEAAGVSTAPTLLIEAPAEADATAVQVEAVRVDPASTPAPAPAPIIIPAAGPLPAIPFPRTPAPDVEP